MASNVRSDSISGLGGNEGGNEDTIGFIDFNAQHPLLGLVNLNVLDMLVGS